MMMQAKAGIDSEKSAKSIFVMGSIMSKPTRMSTGAVAAAGIERNSGEKNRVTTKQMMDKADAAAEDAVSGFLNDNGITYLVWPKAQIKPDVLVSKIHEVGLDAIETNRAVLNAECIKILKIEQVKTDEKNKLIKGSETLIKEF